MYGVVVHNRRMHWIPSLHAERLTCHLPRHQSPRAKCRLACVLAKGKYLFLQMVERGIEVGVWEALERAQ